MPDAATGTDRSSPQRPPAAAPAGGLSPGDCSQGLRERLPSNASSESSRRIHKWKSPLLMSVFFVLGLGMSIAHCAFYPALNTTIFGSPRQQEANLRFGTAFAFLSQIALSASCWQTYTQWIWRSVKRPLNMRTLNDIFGADTSVLWLLNLDMLRNFKVGHAIALFAWTLILPPFFTPGTLFVYDSTNEVVGEQLVPFLTIANSTAGHNYSYSPSDKGDSFKLKEDVIRIFTGPRTIPTLLSTATAAGQILPIKAPYNHSSYTINFFGPAVQCLEADPAVKSKISTLLEVKMNKTIGNAREIQNAYYGFVPAFDSQGGITALADMRYQAPLNGSNQIWMVFERYNSSTEACKHDKYYQVCNLWNATYDLNLSWENGFQNISGSRRLLHTVEYPRDKAGEISNMAQHAYSAFMWVLGDQVVGSFGWFEATDPNNSSDTEQFGMINSPIQHNVLLGSSDLDVFFDYNEGVGACQTPYKELNLQRQQDIMLARNRTLGELIEELSFNMTISLMHNELLTKAVTRLVTRWDNVNRYGYNPTGLFVPYTPACLLTLVTVIIGATTYFRHGGMPGRTFQDILVAVSKEIIHVARECDPRRLSIMAIFDRGRPPTFQPVVKPEGG